MTIIMGMTFRDGAAVAADTLRHNALDMRAAGHTDKTVALNPRVVAAKAGYGPDADVVWEELRNSGIEDLGPAEIANRLREIGSDVYTQCCARANALRVPDPGLYFILSGLELDGRPAIHWLNFPQQDFNHSNTPGFPVAYASRVETNANALAHANNLARQSEDGLLVPLDRWARRLTVDERQHAPHAIGFPINLRIVRPEECYDLTVTEEDGPESGTALVCLG